MKAVKKAKKKVLILGIGNVLMGDDGVGVRVVQRIEDEGISLPDGVDILDGGTAGYELLGVLREYDKLIIVDALRVAEPSGTVFRFPAEHVREKPVPPSTHATGIMEVIRMLGIVDCIPEIEFVGIVAEKTGELDTRLSRAVEEAVPRAVEAVLAAAVQ